MNTCSEFLFHNCFLKSVLQKVQCSWDVWKGLGFEVWETKESLRSRLSRIEVGQGCTRTPQVPFNRTLMVPNGGM